MTVKFIKAREEEWPICPQCKKELRELKYKQRGWVRQLVVFWCPHCLCLLSSAAYWMRKVRA